jgi:hypothetical protein
MNGLIALGYMLIEEGRIVAIRNEEFDQRLNLEELSSASGTKTIVTITALMKADGWEIGWKCPKCMGDGTISVRCPCVDRPRHVQAEDPCCGGWDEAECPECDNGIQWEEEY